MSNMWVVLDVSVRSQSMSHMQLIQEHLRQTLRHGPNAGIALIEFVVKEEVFLPGRIVDNALMHILCTGVCSAGDDIGGVASFVGHVVDGKSVFVVAIANVAPIVFCVWSAVNDAFGIMDVSICGCAARARRVTWVAHVNID